MACAALAPLSVRADTCACDQYKDLVQFQNLASRVAEIGAAHLHREGRTFEVMREEAQAIRLKIAANTLITIECRDKLIDSLFKNRFDLVIRGVVGDGPINHKTEWGDPRLIKFYNNTYVRQFRFKKCPTVRGQPGLTPEQCLEKKYEDFGKFLQTPGNARNLYANIFSINPEEMKVIQAFHQAVNSGSEEKLLALIAANPNALNKVQILELYQMLMTQGSRSVDPARVGNGPTSGGVVTGDQILQTIRKNALLGDPKMVEAVGHTKSEGANAVAGVCRDQAVFGAKILAASGKFKRTFVVMKASRFGVYHSMVMTQDADTGEVIIADYGATAVAKGQDGAKALSQTQEDNTHFYRIFDPNGKEVAELPSEMEKFIAEAGGWDVLVQERGARITSSIIAANVNFGPHNLGSARVFSGQDGIGNNYLGAAANIRYAEGTPVPGQGGILCALQHRPKAIYETETDQMGALCYARIEQQANTPSFRMTEGLNLHLDNRLIGIGALTWAPRQDDLPTSKPTQANFQGTVQINSELHLDQHTGKYRGNYVAGIHVHPIGMQDVRNADLQVPMPFVGQGYLAASGALKISDVTQLIFDTNLIISNLGQRAKLEAGVATRDIAVTGHIAGSVTKNSSRLEDNSIRRAGVTVVYEPVKQVGLSLTGEVPLEGEEILAHTRVLGNLNVAF
ncbi:hypothetical protein WDW37_19775 [Bdellovibrionota bacterium FG-1]